MGKKKEMVVRIGQVEKDRFGEDEVFGEEGWVRTEKGEIELLEKGVEKKCDKQRNLERDLKTKWELE